MKLTTLLEASGPVHGFCLLDDSSIDVQDYFDYLRLFSTEKACLEAMKKELLELEYLDVDEEELKAVKTVDAFYDLIGGNDWSDKFLYEKLKVE